MKVRGYSGGAHGRAPLHAQSIPSLSRIGITHTCPNRQAWDAFGKPRALGLPSLSNGTTYTSRPTLPRKGHTSASTLLKKVATLELFEKNYQILIDSMLGTGLH